MSKEKVETVIGVPEAARRLNRSVATIRRWIKDGDIKGSKIGGVFLIPKSEIDKIMAGEHV